MPERNGEREEDSWGMLAIDLPLDSVKTILPQRNKLENNKAGHGITYSSLWTHAVVQGTCINTHTYTYTLYWQILYTNITHTFTHTKVRIKTLVMNMRKTHSCVLFIWLLNIVATIELTLTISQISMGLGTYIT